MKGTLENLEGKTWSLTAIAKRRDVVRSVISSGGHSKIEAVSVDEVISIEPEASEDADEIYVPKIGLADGLIQHLYSELTLQQQ